MKQTTITDAERAMLANIVYPEIAKSSDVKKQIEQTGHWVVRDLLENPDSGLEMYAIQKVGTDEIVFAVRGSDNLPGARQDWGPVHGANAAFTGSLHEQHKEGFSLLMASLRVIETSRATICTPTALPDTPRPAVLASLSPTPLVLLVQG